MIQIHRALISVSDKTGVIELAQALTRHGIAILSTGGTARHLQKHGMRIGTVEDLTGSPEMLDGRVKTLHPCIHGGILARRDRQSHLDDLKQHGIGTIDLVVVNLYPFRETIARQGIRLQDAIEQIDIGGPAMIRSAAKNHAHVVIVVAPGDYQALVQLLDRHHGGIPDDWAAAMAQKAFRHTAEYDTAICRFLAKQQHPSTLHIHMREVKTLRYGENPHQAAAFYAQPHAPSGTIGHARMLAGEAQLSFNNILDLDAAFRLVKEFDRPSAAIIKHTNPCGCGTADTIEEAFMRASEGDPMSAFGGIVAVNRPLDRPTTERMLTKGRKFDCVVAPGYEEGVAAMLRARKGWGKHLRIMDAGAILPHDHSMQDYKRVEAGLLVQDMDPPIREIHYRVVTATSPSQEALQDLLFAWRVCKHVKSNAVVLARGQRLVGVGAGQMSRVDATRHAVEKAADRARGAVLASDAFFPFPDSITLAGAAGIRAVIQPGGSVKDAQVIAEADRLDMAMLVTGERHFRH